MYIHEYVNHSKNFVDPETGKHMQHFERHWCELKESTKNMREFQEIWSHHLAEFFHRNEICEKDPFIIGIELLKNIEFHPSQ